MSYLIKFIKYNNKIKKSGGMLKPYLNFPDEKLMKIKESRFITNIINICKENNIIVNESSIIDFGSGHGNISLGLSYYFNQIYGYDPSDHMLEIANFYKNKLSELDQEFNKDKVIFEKKSFQDELEIKPVNVILLNNSIHFEKPENLFNTMNNLIRNLTENGLIIIKEPWKQAIFGDPKLNEENNVKRINKIKQIEIIRNCLLKYLKKNTEEIELINNYIYPDNSNYLMVIKKK